MHLFRDESFFKSFFSLTLGDLELASHTGAFNEYRQSERLTSGKVSIAISTLTTQLQTTRHRTKRPITQFKESS